MIEPPSAPGGNTQRPRPPEDPRKDVAVESHGATIRGDAGGSAPEICLPQSKNEQRHGGVATSSAESTPTTHSAGCSGLVELL